MQRTLHDSLRLGAAALVWAALALPLAAAQGGGPPNVKPVQDGAKTAEKTGEKAAAKAGAKAGEKAGAKEAKSAEQAGAKAGEKAGAKAEAKAGAKAGGAHARAHREVLEPVAFEQARYVKRVAQLERISQIGEEKGNGRLAEQAAILAAKNDAHHAKRIAELRAKHGDEQVDSALAWIEERGESRRGAGVVKAAKQKQKDTGAVVDGKARAEAKDKKEKTDEAKEKAKQKAKDKPEGNKEEPKS